MELIGREKETALLQESLNRMMESHEISDISKEAEASLESQQGDGVNRPSTLKGNLEFILIKGFSGVGKTSVAMSIKRDIMNSEHGLFAEGKYDFNTGKEQPYLGIAKAYNEVLRKIKLTRPKEVLRRIGKEICDRLGNEFDRLADLLPELNSIVDKDLLKQYSARATDNIDNWQERWKYSFRILTRLLSCEIFPLAIFIDDLEWADNASLDLLGHVISDSENLKPFMLIGCYRSNEVDKSSILHSTLDKLRGLLSTYAFHMTEMEIQGCNASDVHKIIRNMMDIDDEEACKDLANVCYQRTLGNPFFLVQFMTMLQREELLTFSIGTLTWEYDAAKIEEATVSTANVVELLHAGMRRMDHIVQQVLHYAACLGATFRPSILQIIWTHVLQSASSEMKTSKVAVLTILDEAEKELLIEKCEVDKYRWVHDKVQEAALSVFGAGCTNSSFLIQMGMALFENLSPQQLEDDLFDVVDLINNGNRKNGELISAQMAQLNL